MKILDVDLARAVEVGAASEAAESGAAEPKRRLAAPLRFLCRAKQLGKSVNEETQLPNPLVSGHE